MRYFLPILLLISLGCEGRSRPAKRIISPEKAAIIFVPGYKGSVLQRTDNDDVMWLTGSSAVFGGSPIAWNGKSLGICDCPALKQAGVLLDVSLMFGLIGIDFYAPWLDLLRDGSDNQIPVYSLSYDWRQDNFETVKLLAKLVDKLQAQEVTKIHLVAHSMGGLVSSYYLRYGAQHPESAVETWEGARKLDRIVLAGVPFGGSVKMLRDMNVGVKTGLDTSILTAQVLSSFPSSYQLLPGESSGALVDETRQAVPGLIADVGHWKKYQWGLFLDGKSTELMVEREKFVRTALKQAASFIGKIQAPPNRSSPAPRNKILYLVGRGQPTLSRAVWLESKQRFAFSRGQLKEYPDKLDDYLFSDGDGTVADFAARAPAAYREGLTWREITAPVTHEAMLKEKSSRQSIVEFLF